MAHTNPAVTVATTHEGGFAYAIDKWNALKRFLILGSEGRTLYANNNQIKMQFNWTIESCLKEDETRLLDLVFDTSERGLAPKNEPAIFILACALAHGSPVAKKIIRKNIHRVVRTASHLASFVDYANELRGWGSALRKAVSGWYTGLGDKHHNNISSLVHQTIKYPNRKGFTQRDILRLCHVKPESQLQSTLFKWITDPDSIPILPDEDNESKLLEISEDLHKFAVAKQLGNFEIEKIVEYIGKYNLPHEVIPSNLRNNPTIWQALLDNGMPLNAMIRNLSTFSRLGLLSPLSDNEKRVCAMLTDFGKIHGSRLHPINILNQRKGYCSGRSRGGLYWDVNANVSKALTDAFYQAFDVIVPTNLNTLIALDVSGSMSWSYAPGMSLTCAEIAAAMAMCIVRTEPYTHVVAFSDKLIPLQITASSSLDEVLETIYDCSFGGTYCNLPMVYAKTNKLEVETFHVYTDSETAYTEDTPAESLRKYRSSSGIDSKFVCAACERSVVTLADPTDNGMLDVCGFSTDAPEIITSFCRGEI